MRSRRSGLRAARKRSNMPAPLFEDVLPAIRLAIAEDLRAEARRMRGTYREGADRPAPDGPGEPSNLDSWAKAYEASAHRIEAATYPWRQKPY